jgi:hypothetical protein
MQRSLGGKPHRSDRSQSPSGGHRSATTLLANLAKTSWIVARTAVLLDKRFIGHEAPGRFDKNQSEAQSGP